MKPSKEDVALVAVLFAAIIASHAWAPAAAAAVVSMASVLVGYFFASRANLSKTQAAPVLALVPKSKDDGDGGAS